jgi:hypothetical protein
MANSWDRNLSEQWLTNKNVVQQVGVKCYAYSIVAGKIYSIKFAGCRSLQYSENSNNDVIMVIIY